MSCFVIRTWYWQISLSIHIRRLNIRPEQSTNEGFDFPTEVRPPLPRSLIVLFLSPISSFFLLFSTTTSTMGSRIRVGMGSRASPSKDFLPHSHSSVGSRAGISGISGPLETSDQTTDQPGTLDLHAATMSRTVSTSSARERIISSELSAAESRRLPVKIEY
jgi:hypothetical protein